MQAQAFHGYVEEEAGRYAEARLNALYDRLNLSSACIVAGRFAEALQHALDGLGLAETVHHGFLVAGLLACAAVACCLLGRLDEAEHYAMGSLREEEEVQVHRPYALTTLGWIWTARGRPGRRWAARLTSWAVATSRARHMQALCICTLNWDLSVRPRPCATC